MMEMRVTMMNRNKIIKLNQWLKVIKIILQSKKHKSKMSMGNTQKNKNKFQYQKKYFKNQCNWKSWAAQKEPSLNNKDCKIKIG